MSRGHYRYRSEPAAFIIRQLGGVRALARELGVSPEAVSKCNRPVEKGGTAGKMPREWWSRLAELSEAGGLDGAQVHMRLRLAGKRPRPQLDREEIMHASKRKGDRFERQVVDDLVKAGLKAHRVPLSGAVEGYEGDVLVNAHDGEWKLQCKITTNRRTPSGRAAGSSGRGAIVRFLSQVSFGVVVVGRTTYVAMRRGVFVRMLKGVSPSAVNVPHLVVAKAKLVADAIDGHDALVFRRDQTREWMALVREDRE